MTGLYGGFKFELYFDICQIKPFDLKLELVIVAFQWLNSINGNAAGKICKVY